MSIVGTRPPTLDEWNKYELHHRARLIMGATRKPGGGRKKLKPEYDAGKNMKENLRTLTEDMKRYQNIAVNIVEFIDTVADAIGEQLIENRFIQLMSIYRSKKSKGELYKHAICKAQIIVSYVKGSTYFT